MTNGAVTNGAIPEGTFAGKCASKCASFGETGAYGYPVGPDAGARVEPGANA